MNTNKKQEGKLKNKTQAIANVNEAHADNISNKGDFMLNWDVLKQFKFQAIVLVLIGLAFYSNSFLNEYALDDGIVIQKNEYVQNGFRGIPKILSTDAYDSFYKQMNAKEQLSGGRYRPLSIVTFAIEQQLFGSNAKEKPENDVAFVRHVINVLLYILSVIVLLYFLNTFIFKNLPLIGFISSLIFLIHPIHTEVVANVKSRDEILSFLFITLTFIQALRYVERKQLKHLLYGLICYFMALLSKEYAITLIVLIPVLLYITQSNTIKQSIIGTLPYFAIAVLYLFIRFSIVGKGGAVADPDVLNSPFKFATPSETWATEIEILNRYIRLLLYPNPLSSDYSYNTIPYTNFKDGMVWLSLFTNLTLVISAVVLFFKRNILSFAIAFYLLHLLLVSNIFMPLGATMGERLIYHSSLGFAIVIGILLNKLAGIGSSEQNKLDTRGKGFLICMLLTLVIVGWSGMKVIARNAQWKNDASLFITDASTVPNSALVNGNAGKAYIDMSEKPPNKAQEKELVTKGIYYLTRAVEVHKEYVNGYLNLGVAYFKLSDYDKALENWNIAKRIYPNNPFLKRNLQLMGTVYYNEAMKKGRQQPIEAQKLLEKAIEVDPTNSGYWYNLGGVCFTIGDFEKAKNAWTKTLQLDPNNQEAQRGMAAIPKK